MMKTVPEPNAEFLSAEDVHEDVASFGALLERRRAERKAYEILNLPNVQKMLRQLSTMDMFANEEDSLERTLKTLLTAVTR